MEVHTTHQNGHKKPLKVCMMVDTNFVEDRRVRKEAKTLLNAGYQVTVIAFRRWGGMGSKLPNKKIQMFDGVKLIYIETRLFKRFSKIIRFIVNFIIQRVIDTYVLTRYAIAEKADIYHSNDLDTLLEGFIAAKVNRAKLIYDCHDSFTQMKVPGSISLVLYRPYWKILERLLIRHVDGFMTVSDLFADYFSELYKIRRPVIVYNTSEIIEFKKQNLIRERFKIPEDKKVLLYLGSLFPGRGAELTIDSVAYFNKNIFLVMIGPIDSDIYLKQLRDRAAKISSENIIIAPPIPPKEVYNYLMSADAGIVFYESTCFANNGLPNKLFDYMMAGLPMIASAMSEIRRVINETKAGIAIDNADPKELASAVSRVLSSEEDLEFYRGNARRFALEKYNWTMEAKKILELYRTVMGK